MISGLDTNSNWKCCGETLNSLIEGGGSVQLSRVSSTIHKLIVIGVGYSMTTLLQPSPLPFVELVLVAPGLIAI
jgi:hypothetical protein